MRIVRFSPLENAQLGTYPLYGILENETITVVKGDPIYAGVIPTSITVALKDVRLLAPVIPRSKVVCVGKNYADHAKEFGKAPPAEPLIFLDYVAMSHDDPDLLEQIVRDERAALMVKIREQADQEARKFGVAVVDARIRRVDLPQQISEKVYGRMQTERQREASEYRAQGAEQAQKITAKADRDVIVLKAEAQQKADQVKGEGDAERNRIFAEAFGKDPDFFAFYRSMQAYETAFKPGETRFLVSPRSDFFRYFSTPDGGASTAAATLPESHDKK